MKYHMKFQGSPSMDWVLSSGLGAVNVEYQLAHSVQFCVKFMASQRGNSGKTTPSDIAFYMDVHGRAETKPQKIAVQLRKKDNRRYSKVRSKASQHLGWNFYRL